MQLTDTMEMMTSPDYKERFRAEYFQLQIRIQGLSDMLVKYKAGTLPFVPTCGYPILLGQLRAMRLYAEYLADRAEVEDIDLTETTKESY